MPSTSDAALPMAPDPASAPHHGSTLQPHPAVATDIYPTSPFEFEDAEAELDEYFDNASQERLIQKLKKVGLLAHHEAPSKLCRYCANLSYKEMRGPVGCDHTPNVWTLLQSADECELCARVVEQVTACTRQAREDGWREGPSEVIDPGSRRREEFESHVTSFGIGRDEPRPVRVIYSEYTPGVIDFEVDAIMYKGDLDRWRDLGSLQTFADSRKHMSDPGWKFPRGGDSLPLRLVLTEKPDLAILSVLVRKWMALCRRNHNECNFPGQKDTMSQLPARVVDLREVKSKGKVRVWHTQGSRGRYIALSHCWGGGQPVKTERGNLNQRIEGFPCTDLPSLFRDAVDTSLAIGINYLWIDSLCIIQDDRDDWATEAAKMADVYMNSYLTIAASVAPNSSGRLLGKREPAPKAVRIPQKAMIDGTEEQWSLYVEDRRGSSGADHVRPRSFLHDAHEAPLNKRAWVLQERILSPRTLHFTETQVYWECWRDVEHETLDSEAEYHKNNTFPESLSPCNAGGSPVFDDYLAQWLKVVEVYTGCKLTFASDKLVAIAGLVDRVRAGNTYPFFKGVFLESLHRQLLWVVGDNSRSEFLPEAGAPTWSWASRDGQVHFVELPDLAPHHATRIARREHSGDQFMDLRADLYTLDESVLVGKLRKTEYRGSRPKKKRASDRLVLGNGVVRWRYLLEESIFGQEDFNTVQEDDNTAQEDDNTAQEDDDNDYVVENTDYEDDNTDYAVDSANNEDGNTVQEDNSIVQGNDGNIAEEAVDSVDNEDARSDSTADSFFPHFTGYEDDSKLEDDTAAAVMLDRETGDDLNLNFIFWVLVGHKRVEERDEYYCLLVREVEDSKYVRVGIALVFDNKWLHLCRSDVIVV